MKNIRRKILFVAEGITLAHLVRPLMLAEALAASSHHAFSWEIHFAFTNPSNFILQQFPTLLKGTYHHQLNGITSAQFLADLRRGTIPYQKTVLQQYIADDELLLAKIKPDVIVIDFRLSMMTAVQNTRIPVINITNAHWDPAISQSVLVMPELPITRWLGPNLAWPFFRLFGPHQMASLTAGINQLRTMRQLNHYRSLQDWYTAGDYVLYADLPMLFDPETLGSGNRFFLGPLSWNPNWPLPNGINRNNRQKTIYLGMGSSGNIAILDRIIKVLGDMDVQVLYATAGRVSPQSLPKNFYVQDYISGHQACAIADLMIGNGGSASLAQCLVQGIPMLGLPANMDQHLTMYYAQRGQVGDFLRTENLSAKKLLQSLEQLLSQTRPTPALARAQAQAQQVDYRNIFPALVNKIAGQGEQGLAS